MDEHGVKNYSALEQYYEQRLVLILLRETNFFISFDGTLPTHKAKLIKLCLTYCGIMIFIHSHRSEPVLDVSDLAPGLD